MSAPPRTVAADTRDVLGSSDAVELADRIRSGDLDPLEATQAALTRIRAVDPQLSAVVSWDEGRAFGRAAAHRRRLRERRASPGLDGVPTAIKDNIVMAGMPVTWGSAAFAPRTFHRTGPVAEQLLSTGLNPLCTSRTPEFGLTASSHWLGGVTRNPWDPSRIAGGSSAGAAALVAAGALTLAHGNDGGGSLRIPAACCGLVGFKPSLGRMRRESARSLLPIDIAVDGVIAASVRDVVAFFAAAEPAHRPPRMASMAAIRPNRRRLRILMSARPVIDVDVDPGVLEAVEQAARHLVDLGHQVIPDAPPGAPPGFADDFADLWAALAASVVLGGRVTPGFDVARLEPLTLWLAARARRAALRAPGLTRRLRAVPAWYENSLQGADLVLTPVLTAPAPPVGHLAADLDPAEHFDRLRRWTAFTPLHNVAGAPSVALPYGTTADGLPIGVLLSARRGADRLLAELALQLEEAFPFRRLPAP